MESKATIDIRPMSDCSFEDALKAWNEGFQGYFVDLTLSLDDYLARLYREGLAPKHSLMAFCDDRPAGFLLNGLRTIAGQQVAWNGGTGVSPEFRRRGVATALMRATLDVYRRQSVDVATLEAVSENEGAISLYRRFGYEVVDRLIFLQHEGAVSSSFASNHEHSFSVERCAPQAVSKLSFYQHLVPWQTQWQSISRNHGQALVVSDADGVVVGYALYQKRSDEQGQLTSIVLYQCVVSPYCPDAEPVAACALQHLYAPLDLECRRTTHNLGTSNLTAVRVLREWGFTPLIEQVMMTRLRRE
jgi:ribosomal protein S18 acetylase RimI-like enzyme